MIDALRGEVWEVRFDPTEGDEIRKTRPAVVMTAAGAGRMNLHIVSYRSQLGVHSSSATIG